MHVLIVEDHQDIAANIGDFLEAGGARVDYAYDGVGALHLALTGRPDVIVLDIGLPGMDGLTFCRRLRQDARDRTPVLMLTARDTLADKLAGFDAGTDDYLVKPFALQELRARLDALVRRSAAVEDGPLRVADLELDPGARTVMRGGSELSLGRAPFNLLEALMRKSPNVVPRTELEAILWGDEPPAGDVLRSHLYALRKAVDRDPGGPPLIHTVHGVGYRLAAPEPKRKEI
ncbi:MAG: response regulator transcription factor [Holophagales bacterium]|nr:response regulator transcription factor [Holophagales bacterium]